MKLRTLSLGKMWVWFWRVVVFEEIWCGRLGRVIDTERIVLMVVIGESFREGLVTVVVGLCETAPIIQAQSW
jgi:hypothetical protein